MSNAKTVIGLGEVLWDCFPDARRVGGAPANVVYHATQLGLDGRVFSRVGDDADGRELLAVLQRHGLETRWIQRDPQHPTGHVTVDLTEPDRPRYTIHRDVAWDYLEFTDDWAAACREAHAICFGTLAQRSAVSRETIRRCLEAARDALRVYDVNLRPPFVEREWIERSLRLAQVVKLNEDELRELSRMLEIGADSPDLFASALHERYGPQVVCVTRAERGCVVWDRGRCADVAGERVAVADAVGAGDAFTAALIYGLLAGRPIHHTARLANAVGALVASRPGAMPDVRTPVARLLREVGSDPGSRACGK